MDQQHLTALDNVLDLVPTTQSHPLGAHFVDFFGSRSAIAAFFAATLTAATATTATSARFCFFAVFALVRSGFVGLFFIVAVFIIVFAVVVRRAVLDSGHLVLVAGVDLFKTVFGEVLGERFSAFLFGVVFFARRYAFFFFLIAQASLFFSGLRLFSQKLFAVILRDLVIIRMNFVKGEEAVAIAAKIDKCRLQRGFDPRDFC